MTNTSNTHNSFLDIIFRGIAHTDDHRQNLVTEIAIGVYTALIIGLAFLANSKWLGLNGLSLVGATTLSIGAVLCGIVYMLRQEGWQWS